jgi:uncharacterized protein YbjT (DUF2867 family)
MAITARPSQTNPSMTNDSSTILAIGAAGKFAGMVVPALTKRGARVRGFVTGARQGVAVHSHGAAEIAVGDLRDEASVDAALKGVGAVFYIAPAFLSNEADVGRNVVASAIRAGVRRFVFSSVIHPVLTELENHGAKIPVEEALLDSNMEFVFLHPAMFFQNYAQNWPNVLNTGVLAEPWSIDTRFSRVDYRDVAEVAAIALTENRLNFGTFELCGEGHFNRTDVAKLMSEALGRKITAAKSEIPKNQDSATSASEDPQNSAIQNMLRWYDSHGLLGNSLTLRAILGREPRTLRAFFEDLVAQETEVGRVEPSSPAHVHGRPRMDDGAHFGDMQ